MDAITTCICGRGKEMNQQKLFEMFADLIYDYKSAEENLIWETSGNIERAEKKLEREVAERIENFKAELNSSEWIPCSGCADCTHKECEHYGNI